MNIKRIKKWIKALRSGEYKQGTGTLRDSENKFCCLGVACDLFALESKGHWLEGFCHEDKEFVYNDSIVNSYPSEDLYEWLGIPSDFITDEGDLRVLYQDKLTHISVMNDNGLYTFYDIALILENNFLNKENRDKLLEVIYL